MAANKVNYIVIYENSSQVFAASSKAVALGTPPPEGASLEEKRVLFITYRPDDKILSVHPLPVEEVVNADLIERKKKTKEEDG